MPVYARSDIAAVSISPNHGGCGATHSRPVVGGAPARIWALTCHEGCEDVLRSDTLWSSTPATIPETPDEVAIREDAEKRGTVEQAQSTAAALQNLAKLGDLPQVISQFMAFAAGQGNALPQTQPSLLLCKNGHQNNADAAFCSGCGTPLTDPVPTDRGKALEASEPPATAEGLIAFHNDSVDLESMSISELRELAKSIGAKTARSKEDQIAAIREVRP